MCRKTNNNRRPLRVVYREAPDPFARGMVGGISPIGDRDFGLSDEPTLGPVHRVKNTPWGPQHQTIIRNPTSPRNISHSHDKTDDASPPPYEKYPGTMNNNKKINSDADRDLAPRVLAREMPFSATPNLELPPHFETNSPKVARLIEGLGDAVAAYRAGSVRQRHVRKVQRALRNELYEEEIARRVSQRGRLRCGERCQVWKEIKAIEFGF